MLCTRCGLASNRLHVATDGICRDCRDVTGIPKPDPDPRLLERASGWLTIKNVAARLGRSDVQVRHLRSGGKTPAATLIPNPDRPDQPGGGHYTWAWPAEVILPWIESRIAHPPLRLPRPWRQGVSIRQPPRSRAG